MKRLVLLISAVLVYSFVYSQSPLDFLGSGNEKFSSANFKGAIDDYTKAIALNPEFADAYINRGSARYSIKDYKGAM